jgi:hypothetical protein
MDFGDFIVWALYIFFLVMFLMVFFYIITDLFRDHEVSGWGKAIWVIALIIFPWITALIYLIVRGKGMSERRMKEMAEMQKAQDAYIRDVAGGTGPADQIAQAKSLLDSGAISQEEFDRLKAKALG